MLEGIFFLACVDKQDARQEVSAAAFIFNMEVLELEQIFFLKTFSSHLKGETSAAGLGIQEDDWIFSPPIAN